MTPLTYHPQAHSQTSSKLAMKSMKAGTITILKMPSRTDTTDSTLMELQVHAILEKLYSQGSKSLTMRILLVIQNATLKLNSMVQLNRQN